MNIKVIFATLLTVLMLLVSCAPQISPPASPASVAPESPPAATTLQTLPGLTLEVVSVTSPVNAGSSATLTAKTSPGAQCTITVYYKSGPSQASGLDTKTADSSGRVSWTWKVGSRTTSGDWRIVVKASYGGKTVTQTTYFTVR